MLIENDDIDIFRLYEMASILTELSKNIPDRCLHALNKKIIMLHVAIQWMKKTHINLNTREWEDVIFVLFSNEGIESYIPHC